MQRHRLTRRRAAVLISTLAAAGGVTAVATADDVANNVDTTVDATAEVLALNTGGAAKTTNLYIVPQNGDGKSGCNLTASSSLSVSIGSSNTSVATVSPSSATFTSCGDVKTLTVTPVSQGTATISLTQTANTTGGTFNLDTAKFTASVAPPANTAPSVQVTGVEEAASYAKGSVPAAGCSATDAEDGPSSPQPVISGTLDSDGLGQQTATCSYTDAGGLKAESSVTYSIVDKTAPVISKVVTPATPNGLNGWWTSDVSIDWTVSEPDSTPTLSGCDDVSITTDTTGTTSSCAAISAGGSAGPESVTIKRDATPPATGCGTLPTGWQAANVSLSCTASDTTSGLADAADASFPLSTSVAAGSEDASASTGSKTVSDKAGNSTTEGPHTFSVDRKAPGVSCDPAPTGWSASDHSIACTASDGGSGLKSASDASFSLVTAVASGTETSSAATGSRQVEDAVGNAATAGPITGLKVDKKAPSVTCDGAPAGWQSGNVSVDCTASDGGSGLKSASDASFSLATQVPAGAETPSAVTGSRTIEDGVGNSSTAGPVGPVSIDRKAPVVTTSCSAATVKLGETATVNWQATDGGSGIPGTSSGSLPVDTSSVGTKTVSVPAGLAQDAVGNASAAGTAACSVKVIYDWTGFFSPIDNNGVFNVAKAGSTVPVKFSLGGDRGLAVLAAGYPQTGTIACGASSTEDALEEYSTAFTSGLKYDLAANQYVYNWKTDAKWAGTCRQLIVKLADGTDHRANFKFAK